MTKQPNLPDSEKPVAKDENVFLYHKLVEEVEDYAIIFLSKEGIIKSWNTGAEKIKLYKSADIIGRHFSIFYRHEDQDANLPQQLLEIAQNKGKASHEGWRVRKDGSHFWGSITITALHADDGGLLGFLKVTRDLTERKIREDELADLAQQLHKTNEALRKSEERYHRMIAEVEDYAIILLDTNGKILNWNAGAQKIKGYDASEIVGNNFRIFYRAEDRENQLPEKLIELAAQHGKAQHEGWRVRKDGSTFWGNIVITALHDEGNELIGFSKVTRDLTERKIAEDRVQEYMKELETQNLQLEQFSYIASHDLQEPLRKIRTFINLIETNRHDGEFRERYFNKIQATAERMTEQIQGILLYSRVSNHRELKELVDVNDILQGVLTDFELLIQEKKATINIGRLHPVNADVVQVRQLMINLIGNALKFNKAQPVIAVESRIVSGTVIPGGVTQSNDKQYVEISIADNGIGFDQQYADQIFLLFHRLHSRHEYPGTGIGLTICKKIMDNHNGFIRVNTKPGVGSTFYVYFPCPASS